MDQPEDDHTLAPAEVDEPMPHEVMSRAKWEQLKEEMKAQQK